jgi:Tfp pilus assembly protein PilZ
MVTTTMQYKPFVYNTGVNQQTGQQFVQGIEVTLIEVMAEKLNFRYVNLTAQFAWCLTE